MTCMYPTGRVHQVVIQCPMVCCTVIAVLVWNTKAVSPHSISRNSNFRKCSRVFSNPLFFVVINGLSIIPVRDTPSRRSSSVFRCHTFRRYGNLVYVLWIVPSIVAQSDLSFQVFNRICGSYHNFRKIAELIWS